MAPQAPPARLWRASYRRHPESQTSPINDGSAELLKIRPAKTLRSLLALVGRMPVPLETMT